MLILVKYSAHNPAEKWKMDAATSEDDVVLIQDGVFWAISDEIDSYMKKSNIHAIDVDLDARGYKKEDSKVPVIGYDDMVTLVEKHEQSMG